MNLINWKTIVNSANIARLTRKQILYVLKPKKANRAHTFSSVLIIEASIKRILHHVHSKRIASIESGTKRSILRSMKTESTQFVWL